MIKKDGDDMQMFRNININLYKMYFKKALRINSQYEYLKYMYSWNPKAVREFEKGKFTESNVAYKWMQSGISSNFFLLPDSDEDIFSSKDLFDVCYFNLRSTLCFNNNIYLKNVIYKIIYYPETVSEPFKWEKNTQNQMIHIFEKYDVIQVLCTLLVYAQTGEIYTPEGKYKFRNDFRYVKSYKKEIITRHFDELLCDAVEINMSQISVPSLIDSYDDFFKKNNKNNIFRLLKENPDFKLKILMIDPELPNIDAFLRFYMYGDTFSDSKKVINDSIVFSSDLVRDFPRQVTAKVVNVPMSYSFMQIKKKNSPSIVKVDVYTPFNNSDDRFSLIFDELENKELYDYYVRTFYRMFDNGKTIKI